MNIYSIHICFRSNEGSYNKIITLKCDQNIKELINTLDELESYLITYLNQVENRLENSMEERIKVENLVVMGIVNTTDSLDQTYKLTH